MNGCKSPFSDQFFCLHRPWWKRPATFFRILVLDVALLCPAWEPQARRRHALFAVAYAVIACANGAFLYHVATRGNAGWAVVATVSLVASIASVAIRIYEVGEAGC